MAIVLDIETNLEHNTIWCCVVKDFDSGEVKVWKQPDIDLVHTLKTADTIIGHNIVSFDAPVLNRVWGTKIKLSQCFDTLLVSRLCDPVRDNGHSLESWGLRLGNEKIKFDDFSKFSEEMLTYCIQDVEVTAQLYGVLLRELKEAKIGDQAIKIEHEVQHIIAEQERNGFKLNAPYAQTILCEIKTEMSTISEELQKIFPPIVTERFSEKTGKKLKDDVEVFNVGSRQQIAKRLMQKGWKPEKKTEKGQVVVDDTILEALEIDEAKPIARYLTLQKRAAQIESWLEHLGKDGRIHGKLITMGAVTGRCTHSNPNVAQVPAVRATLGKECRSCWTVDEGNVLVGVDLSGIELRCFAHYLNDEDYINEVVYGDVHTRNQKAFGVATRDLAKTVLYATLYGASPTKIGTVIGSNPKEGKAIIDSFCQAVPAYAKLKAKVERLAEKGRLPGLAGYSLKVRSTHAALNTLLQSAGAIIAKQWIIEVRKKLKAEKIPYKQVAFVHDEIEVETPEQYGEQVGQLCVEAARIAGEKLGFRCPVGAEYHVGKTWAEVH